MTSSRPDILPPVTTLSDVESRMGIPSLESLLHERDELVDQVARLRAVHGSFGTYEALKKIALATIAATLRAKAVAEGARITEASIDEAAHSSPDYLAFVTNATREKTDWVILENRIQGINDSINRGQAVARFLAAEVGLSR